MDYLRLVKYDWEDHIEPHFVTLKSSSNLLVIIRVINGSPPLEVIREGERWLVF